MSRQPAPAPGLSDREAISRLIESALEAALPEYRMEFHPIAPAYELLLLRISDKYAVETVWLLRKDADQSAVENALRAHIRISQQSTGRN